MLNKLNNQLKEIFPLKCGEILIKQTTAKDLLAFKKEIKDIDMNIMTCRPVKIRNDEESLELFESIIKNENNFLLGLYSIDNESKEYEIIGRISFYDYNSRNKSVELGYVLRSKFMKKGYMRRSLKEVCRAILEETEINKIYAQTGSFNSSSIKLLMSLVFKRDAVLRQHHEFEGKLWDDYIFSLLKEDYIEISD
ncbi:MAG: GNAT family N-acetyltransferase [Clostridium sp.]|nr:GNAT family N-acetyltransferase [Clostridium sp.]